MIAFSFDEPNIVKRHLFYRQFYEEFLQPLGVNWYTFNDDGNDEEIQSSFVDDDMDFVIFNGEASENAKEEDILDITWMRNLYEPL